MNSSEQEPVGVDSIIGRMHALRSSGRSHAVELQGEAQRLVDWKEYVLTKPLVSVAAASVFGFAIVRSTMLALSKPKVLSSTVAIDSSTARPLKSNFAGGVISLGTSIASSAIKSYFANLIQRSISEGGSSDRLHEFNSRYNDIV